MGAGTRSDLRGARSLITVDTNLLVYAHRSDSPWFEPKRRALRALVEGPATWAIPWPSRSRPSSQFTLMIRSG